MFTSRQKILSIEYELLSFYYLNYISRDEKY